ncbi:hypothetical protein F383_28253 [Gossypium arboreum]|uniref:Uncharacterized protein n=1 Tax=Gossypium arboreum TaxID=29729 RepID=A0A0B0PAI2_GOSAR|nr:hypothetical protein F383_28253 [Gossypium arboreum]
MQMTIYSPTTGLEVRKGLGSGSQCVMICLEISISYITLCRLEVDKGLRSSSH